jgi:hypothetical protein
MSSSGGLRARAEQVTQSIAGVHDIDNRIVSVPNRGRGGFLLDPMESGPSSACSNLRNLVQVQGRRLENVRDRP